MFNMEIISGIYEVKNMLNNKRYVGSSVNLDKRFKEHLYDLKADRHCNKHLQRAWNKYGEDHFIFSILEICEPIKDTLLFIEQKYLDLKPEYNICKVAGNTMGRKFSNVTKKKMSESKKGKPINFKSKETKKAGDLKRSEKALKSKWVKDMRKPILMVDRRTNIVIKEFESALSAAVFLGRRNKQSNISSVALGKRKTAFGYKWKFKNIKYEF